MTKTVIRANDSSQTPAPATQTTVAPNIQDEEVAGFALGDPKNEDGGNAAVGQELLRWQIRSFALQCLSEMFTTVARDMQANPASEAGLALQARISDLIRMAFLASTSSVVELRISGLKLIDQVLTVSHSWISNVVPSLTGVVIWKDA
jgi:hypothetical protein